MWQVHNQLDKLDVCVVGRAHDPGHYQSEQIQRIVSETNEDLDLLENLLSTFSVKVVRPENIKHDLPAPVTPRDYIGMIGNCLFVETYNTNWNDIRSNSWPIDPPTTNKEWDELPSSIKHEIIHVFNIKDLQQLHKYEYINLKHIVNQVSATNKIICDTKIDTAMICRLGERLIVGTWPDIDYPSLVKKYFPDKRIDVIKSDGHLDGTIAVVSDDLIIARDDVIVNVDGFETFYIRQDIHNGNPETYFDINMLVIDRNNIICLSNNNEELIRKLEERGINTHIFNFRHRSFWDAGLHCITSDLNRINITL